jgi:hypothetical protein
VSRTHGALQDSLPRDVYYRLQPKDDLFAVGLDETSPEKLAHLREVTLQWIARNDKKFVAIAKTLRADSLTVTSGSSGSGKAKLQ